MILLPSSGSAARAGAASNRLNLTARTDKLPTITALAYGTGTNVNALVAGGDTVNQVLVARETRVDRPVDTADFAAALTTPESQSRFVVVDNQNPTRRCYRRRVMW